MKRRTVGDVMTGNVVTVSEDTPFTEIADAARVLTAHGFKAAPVVRDGDDVLVCRLWQDPAEVHVRIQEGVAHPTGRVGRKSLVPVVVRMTAATDGVVDVVQNLGFDHDDTDPAPCPRA